METKTSDSGSVSMKWNGNSAEIHPLRRRFQSGGTNLNKGETQCLSEF